MTVTNKRLLISESRGDSNRCTPCRWKPDQHTTRFSCSVRVWSTTIHISRGPHITTFHIVINRFEQIHCTREEGLRAPGTIHSTTVIRSVGAYPASLPQQPKSSGESQASVDSQLLGLPGPYHRHAIGTFNTCSRGPTERSLIDTGGGYNLRGADLPHTHSTTFPTSCPHFPLVAPPGLHFCQVLTTKPRCWV
jgi:hypothetical protein